MLKYNKYGRIVLDRAEFSDMINNIFEDWGVEEPDTIESICDEMVYTIQRYLSEKNGDVW